MEQKIAELTDKIYKEGVEKGEKEKETIIKSAEENAAQIKENANKEAEKIIENAKVKAEEMKRNMESEIKLSSQQAISSLKQKIVDILMVKAVEQNISVNLSDPDFIKEMIVTIVKSWKIGKNEGETLEVLLPETSRIKLENSLKESIKNILGEGLSVSFSKNIKGGFQIGPKEGKFKISLTDEDFNEFFKEYLRPKTRLFLFED